MKTLTPITIIILIAGLIGSSVLGNEAVKPIHFLPLFLAVIVSGVVEFLRVYLRGLFSPLREQRDHELTKQKDTVSVLIALLNFACLALMFGGLLLLVVVIWGQ